jgi:hypothetical protein
LVDEGVSGGRFFAMNGRVRSDTSAEIETGKTAYPVGGHHDAA